MEPETCNPTELKEVLDDAERMSCEEYLSCLFILVADEGRFQGLKCALDNQYLMYKVLVIQGALKPLKHDPISH